MSDARLRGTGFYRLWVGETISLVGTQVNRFAMPLVAVLTLGATPWQTGVLTATASSAALFFGLPAGVVADRFDRVRIMHLTNLLRATAVISVPVMSLQGLLTIWYLIAVTFVVAALGLLFDSCMPGYLCAVIPRSAVSVANSWMQGGVSVGDLIGPGMAGLLVQMLGPSLTLVVDAMSYVGSSLGLPRIGQPAVVPFHGEPGASHVRGIRAGISSVFRSRTLRPLTFAATHYNIFHSMLFGILTLYAIRVFDLSPALLGLAMVGAGLGGLAGAVVAPYAARRFGYRHSLTIAYCLPGLAIAVLPFVDRADLPARLGVFASVLFVWTAAVVVNIVLSDSIKQMTVPSGILGRTTATVRFLSWGVQPVGALAGGALAASGLGLRGTVMLAAVGLATSAGWLLPRSCDVPGRLNTSHREKHRVGSAAANRTSTAGPQMRRL